MDRETLNEMVKLKFAVRKADGTVIDLVKLAADADYADAVLSAAENLPDESLVLLAMTLRDKFGLLSAQPATALREAAPAEKKSASPATERYTYGARS
ncbi:MAG: hypothetical protein B7Z35_00740 [Hydrogenophilales bacterium 12-61-10]|nr:MAG: hypothetical protein B7Z35_00740 [Hydrogenophilales bacterium 12-61-10]OYX31995.1 MAG: hypothetical protein B7Z03_03070 [Hydrogenophilales bacterium 32-62-9]